MRRVLSLPASRLPPVRGVTTLSSRVGTSGAWGVRKALKTLVTRYHDGGWQATSHDATVKGSRFQSGGLRRWRCPTPRCSWWNGSDS